MIFALKNLLIRPKIENAKSSSSEQEKCILTCFYTLFYRTSSCSASHHAHFSQRSPLLGNWTSHTLEEIREHVEQVALVTKVFIWPGPLAVFLVQSSYIPPLPQMMFA